jgi:hypothetical protein
VSTITRDRTRLSRPTELQLSLLVQGGSLRSPRAARPPAGPALQSPPRSSPAAARAALLSINRMMSEMGFVKPGRSAPQLDAAALARASGVMAPDVVPGCASMQIEQR